MPRTTNSSSVNHWLRVTGKGDWKQASATVFSSEWLNKPSHRDGHRHIVYNYSVGDTYYSGEFFDYGLETDEYAKPGDSLEIRYDPNNPAKSYYPERRTARKMVLICVAIGAGLALLVMILALVARSASL